MRRIVLYICSIFCLVACHNDDDNNIKEKNLPDRTVLIYIAGENNLSRYIMEEMAEMKEGSKSIGNNCLLVWVDAANKKELPYLAQIKDGFITDSTSISDMDISYKDEYSSDPNIMEQVIRYAFRKFPSKEDDYGLVLWGHASGWLLNDSLPYNAMSRKYAYGGETGDNTDKGTGKYWINVPTLGKLLSKTPHLTFIFADCCNFQCLETAYELRNVCDYIIGSPAEIPGEGAPYNTVVPALFNPSYFYKEIVDAYYAQVIDDYMVPLSVIKTNEMEDLAIATKNALLSMSESIIPYPDMEGIIHYYYSYKYYDVNDFMLKYADEDNYNLWKSSYDKAIIYKKMATLWMTNQSWRGYYYDFEVTEDKYGGVSMFVPQSKYVSGYNTYNKDIKNMGWYYAAGYDLVGW